MTHPFLVPEQVGVAHVLGVAGGLGAPQVEAHARVHGADDAERHEILQRHQHASVHHHLLLAEVGVVAEGFTGVTLLQVRHAHCNRHRQRQPAAQHPDRRQRQPRAQTGGPRAPQRLHDRSVTVHGDRRQREHRHVHAQHLKAQHQKHIFRRL